MNKKKIVCAGMIALGFILILTAILPFASNNQRQEYERVEYGGVTFLANNKTCWYYDENSPILEEDNDTVKREVWFIATQIGGGACGWDKFGNVMVGKYCIICDPRMPAEPLPDYFNATDEKEGRMITEVNFG